MSKTTTFEAWAVQAEMYPWLAVGPDGLEVALYGALGPAQIRALTIGIETHPVRVRVTVETIEEDSAP